MKTWISAALAALLIGAAAHVPSSYAQSIEKPRVLVRTTQGDFTIELYPNEAPKSVANFLQYVRDGFYEGTTFHRVIQNFMVQGGGITPDMQLKPTRPPIENEANNGLKNLRSFVAMARTNDPHSATSQFFINVVNNPPLDHTGTRDSREWGYTVFGQVVDGMDVVDRIRFVKTDARDIPVEPVIIDGVDLL